MNIPFGRNTRPPLSLRGARGVLKKEGFTMLELIIVFVIIGILAGVGVPNYKRFQANQAQKESVQLIETELGKAFSSARSHPAHFGLQTAEGSNSEVELFEIKPAENNEEEILTILKTFELPGGMEFAKENSEQFRVIFERPYGDIREDSSQELPIISPIGKKVTIILNQDSGLITHRADEE